ncbi:MAG: metalloregulator ArsR/SmtB family transcription factor [Wenzhouxiangellaceae bacterium]
MSTMIADSGKGTVEQPDPEEIKTHADDAARLLKALANPARLQVLCCLVHGELSVGQINKNVALSQSALSQHLAILRREGLVSTRRSGQTIYYMLQGEAVTRVLEVLHSLYCDESGMLPAMAKAS